MATLDARAGAAPPVRARTQAPHAPLPPPLSYVVESPKAQVTHLWMGSICGWDRCHTHTQRHTLALSGPALVRTRSHSSEARPPRLAPPRRLPHSKALFLVGRCCVSHVRRKPPNLCAPAGNTARAGDGWRARTGGCRRALRTDVEREAHSSTAPPDRRDALESALPYVWSSAGLLDCAKRTRVPETAEGLPPDRCRPLETTS